MKYLIILFFLFETGTAVAQFPSTPIYEQKIKSADSLFNLHEYEKSGILYNSAFLSNNDLGLVKDRYNAACSWALSGNSDSAFYQLFRIARKGNFKNLLNLTLDKDLVSLHSDNRWNELVVIVSNNGLKKEE